jgi:Rad3-related DNA helicase
MKLDCSDFIPRPGAQSTALAELAKIDAKYVLLSAPVGSGKSKIAMAAARGARSAFIVSTQNILIDQYAQGFDDVPMVKGMSRYTCRWARTGMNCEEAGEKYPEHARRCLDYIPARNEFWQSKISVTNLHFAMFAHPPESAIQHRDLLVVDECHGLEPVLLDLYHANVLRKDCAALGVNFDSPDPARMFREFIQMAKQVRDEDGDFVAPELPIEYPAQRRRIRDTAKRLERVDMFDHQNPWHISRDDLVIDCRPLFAKNLAARLFGLADRVLFMSATPGLPKHFFHNLGITNETAFVEVDSDFPRGKGICLVKNAPYISFKNMDAKLPILADVCAQVMRQMPHKKGAVLCASYPLAEGLYERLRREFGHRLLIHESHNRETVVAEHISSPKPTVLMAVNMHEGLDLRDDLARFLIIPKVLYPAYDAWARERQKMDPGYYSRVTAARMVQACGRAIRSADDLAYIFVLDSNMSGLLKRNADQFPAYFHRAFFIGDYVD